MGLVHLLSIQKLHLVEASFVAEWQMCGTGWNYERNTGLMVDHHPLTVGN